MFTILDQICEKCSHVKGNNEIFFYKSFKLINRKMKTCELKFCSMQCLKDWIKDNKENIWVEKPSNVILRRVDAGGAIG